MKYNIVSKPIYVNVLQVHKIMRTPLSIAQYQHKLLSTAVLLSVTTMQPSLFFKVK